MAENLHKGHRKRTRAEYSKQGLPQEPHKQVEMLLFQTIPRGDTNSTAHRLINRFGSLRGVLDAEYQELLEVTGIGPQTASHMRFTGDIARAYNENPPAKPGRPLDTQELAEAYVRERLAGQKSECVLAVFLDAKRRLVYERLSRDTAHSAARVDYSVRVILNTTLGYHAAGVLIGHNHPNGTPMPSKKDILEAARIRDALHGAGLALTDFIIVGEGGETYSVVRGGLLP
ncbi:MAG: hypothetical protein LBH95_02620 [Oscillospiraceae bacterium]|jgi:DNA repair protein RadC|nr:hypothetical protein [Oscillospiraceae bacterium]